MSGTDWLSLHCFAHWRPEDFDRFLVESVAPRFDGLRRDGRLADWFFIRYGEGGPHLRLRALGVEPATGATLADELAKLVAAAPYPVLPGGDPEREHPHGTVLPIAYRPETARYGGPRALPAAEQLFCRSSEIAVRTVAATPERGLRHSAAVDLITATAQGLGLDRLGAARWLRSHAMSWRWVDEVRLPPAVITQAQVSTALTERSGAIGARWTGVAQLLAEGRTAPGTGWAAVVRDWAAAVRHARQAVGGDGEPAGAGRGWLPVWASQLHMLLNRIGITPVEERLLSWLVAGGTLTPDGVPAFFADGAEAADRRYHEASKFRPARPDQEPPPVRAKRPERHRVPAGAPVPLPAAPPPRMTLARALRERRSARGRLTGPVTAAELGSLLWQAHATSRTSAVTLDDGSTFEVAHRPYPSAGAAYAARLRLLAFDVTGLPAGCYEVDGERRALRRFGRPASVAELATTSLWLSTEDGTDGRVEISQLPAMLGLYVRLDALRPRYGLRALRFATLEAGHLAQNLTLVAAALGLSVGTIGGFYDDVAHELLALDGLDDLLLYLLPVGRSSI